MANPKSSASYLCRMLKQGKVGGIPGDLKPSRRERQLIIAEFLCSLRDKSGSIRPHMGGKISENLWIALATEWLQSLRPGDVC